MGVIKRMGFVGLLALLAGGCTHLKGVVVDEISSRPVPSAFFTVGHPSGVGVSAKYPCDAFGKFDFTILPIDEDFLYVSVGRADSDSQIRRVDKIEMGTNMVVRVHQGAGTDQP